VSTLIEYPDVEQRSEQWHDLRRGMVTASTVAQLLTPTLKVASNDTSRAVTTALVAERITGVTEPTFTSDDMWRGVLHEPIARDYYSQHHAPASEYGFMARQFDRFEIGLSPDGVVGDDGLIEIKCPRAKGHLQTILADRIPAVYMAQCQTALLVSGRKWLDYVSFHAGLPLFVKRTWPNTEWHDAIKAAVEAFERNAVEIVANYRNATKGLPLTERVPDFEEVVI
jgi:putative phage-type endonuclease